MIQGSIGAIIAAKLFGGFRKQSAHEVSKRSSLRCKMVSSGSRKTPATLRFPLPAPVRTTLTSNLNDCFFSFALNVNQTNWTWILDNLRFTP